MKEPEYDDPMELQGFECDGDPGYMVDCVVEEYLRMGWPPDEVFHLFESPVYPPLHYLLHTQGPEAILRKIEQVAARCGVFRYQTREAPPNPELVAIRPLGEGDSHDE